MFCASFARFGLYEPLPLLCPSLHLPSHYGVTHTTRMAVDAFGLLQSDSKYEFSCYVCFARFGLYEPFALLCPSLHLPLNYGVAHTTKKAVDALFCYKVNRSMTFLVMHVLREFCAFWALGASCIVVPFPSLALTLWCYPHHEEGRGCVCFVTK